MAGIDNLVSESHSRSSSSTDSRSMPGIETIGCRCLTPLDHEHGVNQGIDRELGLPHQPP